MKAIAVALMVMVANLLAERNEIKPSDFEPLTSLPWTQPGATLETVLGAIFRETNPAIRYSVLAEYLKTIPIKQLDEAFNRCIALEGTQRPTELVAPFLEIWAQRDPKECWKRTKKLFHLVGIEDGWLGYDGWKTRPPITVQDLSAIRASSFWLESEALKGFPLGVEASKLPAKERVQILREFSDTWFRAFGSWPGYRPARGPHLHDPWHTFFDPLKYAFQASIEPKNDVAVGSISNDTLSFEIGLRRWMLAYPADAPRIIARAQEAKWPSSPAVSQVHLAGPTVELLMIWAKADLPGIIKWAETLDPEKEGNAFEVKGLLMSRGDIETRERWLAAAKSAKPENEELESLLEAWAAWDPKPALEAALAAQNEEAFSRAANAAVYGAWTGQLWNTSHYGLGIIREFSPGSLPVEIRKRFLQGGSDTLMEQWGDIDIGEAARYGFNFLLETGYAPMDRLARFFGGEDLYPAEDGMIDRTFCALRVWAVTKPAAMNAWISTVEEGQMRKALTWLLNNPWGANPKK